MTTSFEIGLFLHIAFLLLGFSAGTVMLLCAARLRAATTGAEAFPWGMLAKKTATAFPVAIVGLFLSGAYMTHEHSWSWSSGWIVAGIVGLVVLMGEGAILGGAHGKELGAALKKNGPGPLSDEVRALNASKVHWVTTVAPQGLVLAIIWNMLHKPGLAVALVDIAVGWGAGAAIGLWVASKAPAGTPEAAPSAATP